MIRFVSYLRVSTQRQGASGLGLEAQRQAVASHIHGCGGLLAAEFIEVESGKRNDRPELAAALAHCAATGSTLVVAKLDRLARNLRFIATVMDSGAEFVACDFPMANRLTLHILAAVAEHEGKAISSRIKASMAVIKQAIDRDGTWLSRRSGKAIGRLGSPLGAAAFGSRRGIGAADAVQRRADEHAARVLPIVANIRQSGITSLRGIANELDQRGILTARGGRWDASRVRVLLQRGEMAAD